MKKTIILAVPYMYGLDQCIEKNLRFLGFEVINLCYDDRDSYYPNLGSRLKNLYHKHITKDGNYKKYLKYSRYLDDIQQKLASLNGKKADYALCIRANIYPKEIIATIREHSNVCVNYQWDGVGRFPDIIEYLDYFDQCWVFDPDDIQKYPQCRFKATTNFYFDFPVAEYAPTNKLYFLGGYELRREEQTKRFIQETERLNLPLDFHIYCKDDRAEKAFGHNGIRYLDRSSILSFEENLSQVQSCGAVVDFAQFEHYGLSFRIFDALRFDKKLITTNKHILETDLYHPDRVFVWDGGSLDALPEFLARPYQQPDPEIKAYYSFTQWLNRLLGID